MWKDYLKKEVYDEVTRLERIAIGSELPTPEEKKAILEPVPFELARMVREKFAKTKFLQETPSVLDEALKKVLQGSPDNALKLLSQHLSNLINESKVNPEILYDYGWSISYVRDFGDIIDMHYEDIKEGKIDESVIRYLEGIVERTKLIGIESMLPYVYDSLRKKFLEVV
jgi:hypothetical protein